MTRVVIHSAVLVFFNFAGAWLGFLAYAAVKPADQLGVQFVVALVVTVAGYLIWSRFTRTLHGGRLCLHGWRDGHWVYLFGFAWAVAVFVPLHYVTQGYRTSLANVAALWGLQVVVNGVALGVAVTSTVPRASRSGEST